MSENSTGGPKVRKPFGAAFSLAVAGFFVTALLFLMARSSVQKSFLHGFEADAIVRSRMVVSQLEEAIHTTEIMGELESASEAGDETSFRRFALPLVEKHDGIRSFFFAPVVPAVERADFESRSGLKIFEFGSEGSKIPAARRDFYYPVVNIEPKNPLNSDIPGFDAGSTPERREALERARDSGSTAATEAITLVSEDNVKGFIVYRPLYATGLPPATVEERRRAIRGYVATVFEVDKAIRAALEKTIPVGLPFEVVDFSASGGVGKVYEWKARLQGEPSWRDFFYPPLPVYRERFSLAGKEWGVIVSPNKGYVALHYPLIYCLILPAGIISTMIVAALIYIAILRRRISEACKEVIRESEERLRLAVTSGRLGLFDLDLCNGRMRISDEYLTMLGYAPGEIDVNIERWADLLHPDDREGALSVLQSLTEGKIASYQVEYRLHAKGGEWRWIQSTGKVVGYDENSKPLRLAGVHADITEKKTAELEREKMLRELREALDNVKTLEGLLPICSSCKKIHDDKGQWVPVESYIRKNTGADFTHGICPECAKKLYPELGEE